MLHPKEQNLESWMRKPEFSLFSSFFVDVFSVAYEKNNFRPNNDLTTMQEIRSHLFHWIVYTKKTPTAGGKQRFQKGSENPSVKRKEKKNFIAQAGNKKITFINVFIFI